MNNRRVCRKCYHEWKPRKAEKPKTCPACKTIYWDKERKRHVTKGEASSPQSLEYRSWAGMIQRCTNVNNPMYSYYGGKGIKVCEEWRKSYSTFLKDMGRRPSKLHTLDRKDSTLGYNPDNCKWSTREEQTRNRPSNVLTEEKVRELRKKYKGGLTKTELSKYFSLSLNTVCKVINNITWKNVQE